MTTLVVGASGATGRLLVDELVKQGETVRVIVRDESRVNPAWREDDRVDITEATLLDMSDEEMAERVRGCSAVASCLGHNLSFKGMYGKPRRLVTEAARRLCQSIRGTRPEVPVRFILMNTTGNRNRDLGERVSFGHALTVGVIRALVPPHWDNEQAAEVLRSGIGQNSKRLEWCVVRPDGLVDQEQVTTYRLHPSPTRDPIFNPGKTSRVNVAHFMASLITDNELFREWRGQMPVIYNEEA